MKIDAFIRASGRRFLFRHVHLLQEKNHSGEQLDGNNHTIGVVCLVEQFFAFRDLNKKNSM
jgi:hypothetical protein